MNPDGGALVLGIDVATAAVRVLAVDVADGRVVTSAAAPLPPPASPHPGELEQPPIHAELVRSVIRAVSAALGPWVARVRALSVTATSGSVVPADPDGHPVGAVLLYADQRGAEAAVRMTAATGRPVGAASTLARLAWLAAASGDSGPRRYLHVPDVVV